MARRLSKAQSDLRCENSRAARSILHRRALKSKISPVAITYEHPISHFGAPIKVVDAETRALIEAWEARRS